MALLEDLFKINPVTGLVVSIGVVLLGPIVLPVVGQILRPAVKAVIKGGMILCDEVLEIGEAASDLFTEAHAELASETAQPVVSGATQDLLARPAERSRKRRQKSST